MQKRIIYTDKNMRELNRTLDGRFPLRVEHERLSDFLHSTAVFHWHPEVEFALVTDGSVICQINDTPCRLTAGDGICAKLLKANGIKVLNETQISEIQDGEL